ALERGDDVAKTGRHVVTFKESATDAGIEQLQSRSGFRVANARDFAEQAVVLEQTGDADAVVFPEIGVAVVGGEAFTSRNLGGTALAAMDTPVHSVDPEYFMFANDINPSDYLKGFMRAAQTITADLGEIATAERASMDVSPEVLGVTWGLAACRVPPSSFSG